MSTDPAEAPPRRFSDRLRAAGTLAWSLVGVGLLIIGLLVMIMVLRPIVLALLVALFLAIVFLPVVDALARHRVPRALGAVVALLIVIAVGAGAVVLVVWGIADQREQISRSLSAAVGKVHDIIASVGANGSAAEAGERSVQRSSGTLLAGLAPALGNLLGTGVNVLLGLFVALFVCFFLLKDGHDMAARAAGWIPLPGRLGQQLLNQAATVIRRYFVGLTLLGAVNAVAVAIGALILRVPLVGAIAVITLLGTYVPYLGAAVASVFAVLIALGAGGRSTAAWMILVVILANTLLQNLVSPFAFGATLRLSAPVVLLAAMLGGGLAGVAGLTLATPVTAIVTRSIEVLRQPQRLLDEADLPPPTGATSGGHPADPDPAQ
ncbi:AI-2E family transporter [Planosporangium sp. 12N6]|uniref:AI-2E family transporter n=1 Tax=Planosporangium spinosum TaxID=3402278 RepID=UPI003CF3E753